MDFFGKSCVLCQKNMCTLKVDLGPLSWQNNDKAIAPLQYTEKLKGCLFHLYKYTLVSFIPFLLRNCNHLQTGKCWLVSPRFWSTVLKQFVF